MLPMTKSITGYAASNNLFVLLCVIFCCNPQTYYETLELKWIETVYDIDQCVSWVDHAKQIQAKVWSRHGTLAINLPDRCLQGE